MQSDKGQCDRGKALWIREGFLRLEEDSYASEEGFCALERVLNASEGV